MSDTNKFDTFIRDTLRTLKLGNNHQNNKKSTLECKHANQKNILAVINEFVSSEIYSTSKFSTQVFLDILRFATKDSVNNNKLISFMVSRSQTISDSSDYSEILVFLHFVLQFSMLFDELNFSEGVQKLAPPNKYSKKRKHQHNEGSTSNDGDQRAALDNKLKVIFKSIEKLLKSLQNCNQISFLEAILFEFIPILECRTSRSRCKVLTEELRNISAVVYAQHVLTNLLQKEPFVKIRSEMVVFSLLPGTFSTPAGTILNSHFLQLCTLLNKLGSQLLGKSVQVLEIGVSEKTKHEPLFELNLEKDLSSIFSTDFEEMIEFASSIEYREGITLSFISEVLCALSVGLEVFNQSFPTHCSLNLSTHLILETVVEVLDEFILNKPEEIILDSAVSRFVCSASSMLETLITLASPQMDLSASTFTALLSHLVCFVFYGGDERAMRGTQRTRAFSDSVLELRLLSVFECYLSEGTSNSSSLRVLKLLELLSPVALELKTEPQVLSKSLLVFELALKRYGVLWSLKFRKQLDSLLLNLYENGCAEAVSCLSRSAAVPVEGVLISGGLLNKLQVLEGKSSLESENLFKPASLSWVPFAKFRSKMSEEITHNNEICTSEQVDENNNSSDEAEQSVATITVPVSLEDIDSSSIPDIVDD